MKTFRKALAEIFRLLATPTRGLIHLYRMTLSPDHSWLRHWYPYGFCRHEPTCSSYALIVLEEQPYLVAIFLIIRRIFRCNPWTKISDEKIFSIASRHT